jgi:aldehyde:ferredoxin oxidoreductase
MTLVELSDEAFNWAKRRYYELMKWDADSGTPKPECLEELQLNALLETAG